MNELIIVKQLPIIEEQLQKLSLEIDEKLKEVDKLVVSEETVKEIKQLRAGFNKEFDELEEQRKIVKNQVLKPYEEFENIYKELISNKYKNADLTLKAKIDEVESNIKIKKEQEVREYFEELKQVTILTFRECVSIEFEQIGLNITLSASLKSLKEQVKDFMDKVVQDLNTIETMEHKDELKVEYMKNLDLNLSIQIVNERYVQLEKMKETQAKPVEEIVVEKPTILEAPTKIIEEEKLTTTFMVTATKQKLIELKEFLEKGGYEYE